MEETAGSRRKRKEEGKQLKRQRIQEAGGVRPRKAEPPAAPEQQAVSSSRCGSKKKNRAPSRTKMSGGSSSSNHHQHGSTSHRFGRVMEQVPCRGQPRIATVSMAVPGSIVANCQTRELRTHITGQIARAAAIYHVDEIIVFDDQLSKKQTSTRNNYYRKNRDDQRRNDKSMEEPESSNTSAKKEDQGDDDNNNNNNPNQIRRSSDPHAFMARILQYCDCPQYLRRHFFPMHPDLQFAGLLAPVDAPHHVRAEDRCPYREGVVLDKTHAGGSLVNCGIRSRPVHIDQKLQPGIRCTVELDLKGYGRPGPMHGKVVSPNTATRTDGTYWGYTVRLASSIKAVFDECPYQEGKYDLTIGTSERGNESIEDAGFTLLREKQHGSSSGSIKETHYKHALIVFGGVAGIEECVDADESLKLSGSASHELFDKWINVCPFQGSRTIRSEEAVLIALAKLSPFLSEAAKPKSTEETKAPKQRDAPAAGAVKLSDDDALSEESSDSSDDDDKES